MLCAAGVLAAATAWYVSYVARSTPSGGTWPGLLFGIAGSIVIVYCMLLSVRKALRTAPLGRAHHWMQAHVWFGLISYPLIWFHAAFRIGGALTTVLMILFTIVWLSGIVGLILQHSIPSALMRKVPRATIHEQIAGVIERMRRDAESIVAAAAAPVPSATIAMPVLPTGEEVSNAAVERPDDLGLAIFTRFHAERVAPALAASSTHLARHGGPALAAAFTDVRGRLPDMLQEPLSQLEQLVRQRLQLERQRRLHAVLHNWLLIHVPLSYAMLALSVIHAVMALKYRAIG